MYSTSGTYGNHENIAHRLQKDCPPETGHNYWKSKRTNIALEEVAARENNSGGQRGCASPLSNNS